MQKRLEAIETAQETVLKYLRDNVEIPDSGKFAESVGIEHTVLDSVIKSLHGFRLVDAQDIKRERWVLTDEGKSYAVAGSPEVQVFLAVPEEGIAPDEMQKKVEPAIFKIGRSQAIKNKWIEMGKQLVSRKVSLVEDRVKYMLVQIQNGKDVDKKDIDDLKRRKLISLEIWKGYSLKKGPEYSLKRTKAATDLTREQMQSSDWKDMTFKEYNFTAKGKTIDCGHLHPLLKCQVANGNYLDAQWRGLE